MAVTIVDGLGRGKSAGVSNTRRLLTNAQTNLTAHFVSANEGLAFNVVSIDPSADAADYIFYFKNTSTTHLCFIDLMRCQAVNAALWKVTDVTGTATGTTITPRNMNRTSGVTAEATALGNAAVGGLTAGHVLAVARSPAATSVSIPFDDVLILGTNNAIAVEYDTGTTGLAEVLMRCYFQKLTDVA